MTFWNLYFILKFALFATGHLQPVAKEQFEASRTELGRRCN